MFLNLISLEQTAKSLTPKSIPKDKSLFKVVWFSSTSIPKLKYQYLPS